MRVNVRDMIKVLEGLDPEKPVLFYLLDRPQEELEIVSLFNETGDENVTVYLD